LNEGSRTHLVITRTVSDPNVSTGFGTGAYENRSSEDTIGIDRTGPVKRHATSASSWCCYGLWVQSNLTIVTASSESATSDCHFRVARCGRRSEFRERCDLVQ
jgi:hypothetical protein